ncbi:MAG: ABC transporter ATP-binding protein [Treponema sp.]|nr:ABC transporter ATP-binding protein [Treponema sp.]
MEAQISIKNLSIGIKKRKKGELLSSVEDISFDIFPGEILGLVGESGSGKSLTALSIAGLLGKDKEITSGSIIFKGEKGERDLVNLSENEFKEIRGKEISFIFQEPFSALNPLMRIGDQISETLYLHGERDRNKAQKLALDYMERLGLENPRVLYKAYPHQLSGGMCQRVMIALAIICKPKLLIADEPTTALDHKTEEKILSLLKEINSSLGLSILFISHDLGVIKDLCSRILIMYSGKILEYGNTQDIFTGASHEYTRGLIDSIPKAEGRGKDLKAIPGRIPSLEEGRPQGCPFHPRCNKAGPGCKKDFPPSIFLKSGHTTHCINYDK